MKIWVLTAAFVNFYRLRGLGFFLIFFLLFLSNQTEPECFLTFSVLWPRICNNDLGFRSSMKWVMLRLVAEKNVGKIGEKKFGFYVSFLNFNLSVPFSTKESSDFSRFPPLLGSQTQPYDFLIIASSSGFVLCRFVVTDFLVSLC